MLLTFAIFSKLCVKIDIGSFKYLFNVSENTKKYVCGIEPNYYLFIFGDDFMTFSLLLNLRSSRSKSLFHDACEKLIIKIEAGGQLAWVPEITNLFQRFYSSGLNQHEY